MTDKTIINEKEDDAVVSRRSVLAKLGLAGLALYSAPVLLNLSDAEAGSRKTKKKTKKSKKTSRGKGGHKSPKKTKKSKKTRRGKN